MSERSSFMDLCPLKQYGENFVSWSFQKKVLSRGLKLIHLKEDDE